MVPLPKLTGSDHDEKQDGGQRQPQVDTTTADLHLSVDLSIVDWGYKVASRLACCGEVQIFAPQLLFFLHGLKLNLSL